MSPPIATCATRGDGYIERYSTFQNIVMKYAIIGLIIGSVFISGCASDVEQGRKSGSEAATGKESRGRHDQSANSGHVWQDR